ncbi:MULTISPECIES: lmo0937 family membrane protein [unclassified Arcicella]
MIAFLLLISWVISVFMFSINGLVHLFLVFALITVLISIIHKEM